jgi:hypothetical protein
VCGKCWECDGIILISISTTGDLEIAQNIIAKASVVAKSLQGRSLVVQKDASNSISSGVTLAENPVTVSCLVLTVTK